MSRQPIIPKVGLFRDQHHRYYWAGEGPMISATTAIGVLDKPAVVGWAKREVAKSAVRNLPALVQMVLEGGPDAAARWLQGIPDFKRDKAANLGSRVHHLAEQIVRGESPEIEPIEAPFVVAYQNFLRERFPIFLMVEEMVCSLRYGYGGTLDAIARIGDDVWLLDIKTGGAYEETALQLAAYARAEFIGREADPKQYRIPAATRFGVIHLNPLTPDRPDGYADTGYRLIPYEVGDREFDVFLAALRAAEWKRDTKQQSVIGEPVALEEKAA